jgi:glycosyltransferase involved in cell wall biosynthesis
MKAKTPKILAFNRYFLPGYRAGGPIRTLSNMVFRLADVFDFNIVTQDRDAGEVRPYPEVFTDRWMQVGLAAVRYLPKRKVSLRQLRRIVGELSPDIIYLNSFFDPIFTRRILLLRRLGQLGDTPVVLAPRGEFSPGALGLKAAKKRIYMWAARLSGLYDGLRWQASSPFEKADILRVLPFVSEKQVYVAPNLTSLARDRLRTRKLIEDRPLRICFLSRISQKKNLDFALRCLSQVKSRVTFTVYGPKEDLAYWLACEQIISELPSNVSVVYGGEIEHSQVHENLSRHDLFFFPTRGENYGHVIHEALGAGLPVLISDQTPWTDLEVFGVGWAYPLTKRELFAEQIDRVACWKSEDWQKVAAAASEYALRRAEDADAFEANKLLFRFR